MDLTKRRDNNNKPGKHVKTTSSIRDDKNDNSNNIDRVDNSKNDNKR